MAGLTSLVISSAAVGASAASAPSNDNIAGAKTYVPVDADASEEDFDPQVFNSTNATVETNEPARGPGCSSVTHTGWYKWTADKAGTLLAFGFSDQPSGLAVYTGVSQPTIAVGCDQASASEEGLAPAQVSTHTAIGTTYWIQVGDITSKSGEIDLLLVLATKPANDDIAHAKKLDPGSASFEDGYSVFLAEATTEANEPQPKLNGCTSFLRTRWYEFTADSADIIDVTAIGGGDIQAAVYSGASAPTTELGCSVDDEANHVRLSTTPGTRYWIQAGTIESETSFGGGFDLTRHEVPSNDAIASVERFSADLADPLKGIFSDFDTTLATKESSEPQPSRCTSAPVGTTIWYDFTVPERMVVDLRTIVFSDQPEVPGTDVLALYSGANAPSTLVQCSTYDPNGPEDQTILKGGPAMKSRVVPGTRYWVQVSGTEGKAGEGFLAAHTTYGAPLLTQTSYKGNVTFSLTTSKNLKGKTVTFSRRSGISKKVVPLGTSKVGSNGVALRGLKATSGQTLAVYAKVQDVTSEVIDTPYSNTVTFKVR